MSSDTAISVRNVSKSYTIWRNPAARLKHPLLNMAGELFPPLRKKIDAKLQGLCSEFYALKDISFEVKKGESVGIIGKNGSGKSTLLQIIAGTLQPSEGSVAVNGRVAALLELGSGFNPEFTGRENVFLNASILGLTREETEERFEKIANFADIGKFINQPVKTYSSGMVVRLAFAVVAHVDADVLIVDEALAVGDYFFQQKCAGRMRELREAGTTLFFVSHDMSSVRDSCQKALYLNEGKAIFWGASEMAINCFFNKKSDLLYPSSETLQAETGSLAKSEFSLLRGIVSQKNLVQLRAEAAWWLEEISQNISGYILGVIFYNSNGLVIEKIKMTEQIKIKVLVLSLIEQAYYLSISFKNKYSQIINVTTSYLSGENYIEMRANSAVKIEFCFDLNIEAGKYSYQIMLAKKNDFCNRGETIHETPWLGPLEVTWDYENQKAPFFGMFGIPVKVSEVKRWESK